MNKKIRTIGIVLVVLLAMAISVEALKPTMIRSSGESAYADMIQVSPDGSFTDNYTSVWKVDGVTTLYMSIYTGDANGNYKNEYGFLSTTDNIFETNKKLDKATLIVPEIQLGTDVCDSVDYVCTFVPTRTLHDVQVQWTGNGPVMKGSFGYKMRDGTIFFRTGDDSLSRNAIADGGNLGTTNYASLNSFKSFFFEHIGKQK